jgi:hypothetical protein
VDLLWCGFLGVFLGWVGFLGVGGGFGYRKKN